MPVRLLVLVNAVILAPGDFFHDVPAEVTAMATTWPQRLPSERSFAEPWPGGGWPSVPTLVLQGRDDRLFPLPFARRLARDRLGLELVEVPGGHLVALSQPEQLARRLAVL